MNEILFYLISTSLFLVIIKEAMGIFFVKKDLPFSFSLIVWIVFLAVDICGTEYIAQPFLLLILEIATSLFFCILLYYGSIIKKIVCVAIINLLGMISEVVVGLVFIFLDIRYTQYQIAGSLISKLVLLTILRVLKALKHSSLKRKIPFSYWCMLFSVPMGSIFILNTLFMLCEKSDDKNAAVFCLISSGIILVLNFMIFKIYEELAEKLELKKQQAIFDKEIELCKEQLQEREVANLNIRKLKHDIENHLMCIREYAVRKEFEGAIDYIDDILNGENYLKNNSEINTGNIVVDTLLNYKKSVMEKSDIKLNLRIEIPQKHRFNDADICVILGNCLDNSIEAVCKLDDVSKREVNVDLVYRKKGLLIRISNPFSGDIKKDTNGNLVTTKADKENHGMGLCSVKNAVSKYNGAMNISTDNSMFKVQILLY